MVKWYRTNGGFMIVLSLLAAFIPAYLDPGSGSILFQALVGGLMAAGLLFKTSWRRVRRLFARGAGKATGADD